MATNHLLSCNYEEDEEFIYMEVSSSSSPSKNKEFQMVSISSSFPADELFYNGKILPLQSKKLTKEEEEEEFITISAPLMEESCNLSSKESCRVSTEKNSDEFLFKWSTELTRFIDDQRKKYFDPWSKKLRLIKHFSISQKLRDSKVYLKSFFNKSIFSSNGSLKMSKISAFEKSQTLGKNLKGIEEQGIEGHGRSFSGAIQRKFSSSSSSGSASASASSSSSSSFNYSNGAYEFKRDSSADSEFEGSIEAAIDHCKKSQNFQEIHE